MLNGTEGDAAIDDLSLTSSSEDQLDEAWFGWDLDDLDYQLDGPDDSAVFDSDTDFDDFDAVDRWVGDNDTAQNGGTENGTTAGNSVAQGTYLLPEGSDGGAFTLSASSNLFEDGELSTFIDISDDGNGSDTGNGSGNGVDTPAPIPLPASWALLGLGLAGLGVARRKKRA